MSSDIQRKYDSSSNGLHRRQLIKSAGAASLALASSSLVVPPMVFGQPMLKSDRVRVAAIGFGGRGKADMDGMKSHAAFQLTAACDVDKSFHPIADKYGDGVKKFQDYRKLFSDAADSFDAVLIATPDHMHGPIAMMAMENNKHVYLQKPLAQDIGECRLLAEAAAKRPELATQMGIQIHAHGAYRTAVSWIQSGLIGIVSAVHSWSGKGWGGEMKPQDPTAPPESLDWNLYCGVSEKREYVDKWYHRNNWRKWLAFGTGTQGDMGCHIVDPVFNSLELKEPTKCTSLGPKPFKENFALISKVVYSFKGTKYTTDNLDLTWYNGSLRPTELAGIPKTEELPHQGSMFIGSEGSLILPHIGNPSVFNLDGTKKDTLPEKVEASNHFHDWLDAVVGEKEESGAPFGYAGPLTEAVLMGTVINRWPKMEFHWDATKCVFTGDSEEVKQANALLRPAYRSGW